VRFDEWLSLAPYMSSYVSEAELIRIAAQGKSSEPAQSLVRRLPFLRKLS